MQHTGKPAATGRQDTEQASDVYTGDYAGRFVIFLDVDGVLNCISTKERLGSYTGIDETKLPVLKEIADMFDAVIVLISTWKDDWHAEDKANQDDFANELDRRLAAHGLKVISKTRDQGSDRGAGIMAWMKVHGPVKGLLILDDEWFDYRQQGLTRYLLKTSYYKPNGGLHQSHVRYLEKRRDQFMVKEE